MGTYCDNRQMIECFNIHYAMLYSGTFIECDQICQYLCSLGTLAHMFLSHKSDILIFDKCIDSRAYDLLF